MHSTLSTQRAARSVSAALALVLFAASPSLFALEYELSLQLGVDQSDNIDLEPAGLEDDETETSAAAIVRLSQDTKHIDLLMDYVLEQSHYQNDRIENETQVQGSTDLEWLVFDETLIWDFRHLITEARVSEREVDTPDTRETRNVFSTGPTISARLSGVDRLVLSADYTKVDQETANVELLGTDVDNARNLDSERTLGRISWRRAISQTSSFSIGYSQGVTEFDDDSPDFEYQQVSASYNVLLASGAYGIELGFNEAERDGQDDKQDGTFAAISYNNDFGGRTLEFRLINQLTDSSIGLGADGADVTDSNFNIIDIVERTNARIIYGYDAICRSCDWEVSYEYDKEDFKNTDQPTVTRVQDTEEHTLRSVLRYGINSRATSYVGVGYTRAEFEDENREDDRYNLNVGLEYKFAERVDFDAGVNYRERDTERDENEDLDIGYEEFSAYATVTIKIL